MDVFLFFLFLRDCYKNDINCFILPWVAHPLLLCFLQDIVPSFVSILKQITDHRLPREFDYHRMPAPWIQMRLLRILALLGRADRVARLVF